MLSQHTKCRIRSAFATSSGERGRNRFAFYPLFPASPPPPLSRRIIALICRRLIRPPSERTTEAGDFIKNPRLKHSNCMLNVDLLESIALASDSLFASTRSAFRLTVRVHQHSRAPGGIVAASRQMEISLGLSAHKQEQYAVNLLAGMR